MSSSSSPPPAIRESHVAAAVQFFASTGSSGAAFSRKLRFLESQKSLTPSEAAEAMRRFAPDSPEARAVDEGVRAGKTATEAMEEWEKANPGAVPSKGTATPAAAVATPTPTPTSHSALPAAPSTAAPAYQYATPPGYIAGPPSYPGGPPTLYPLPGARSTVVPPPAAPAASGWRTAAWVAAGVIGGAAAIGLAAKKMGWELIQPTGAASGASLPAGLAASAGPADSLAALVGSNPAIPAAAPSATGSADHRLTSGRASVSDHGDETLTRALAAYEASDNKDEADEEEEPAEEKYLGAWLGDSSASSARRVGVGARDALAVELRNVSEKLDRVVEALKDNQIELRRISGSRTTPSATDTLSSTRLESLLAQSAQTQTDMLATLKIMLAAQARAAKEAAEKERERERAALGTVQPETTPSATSSIILPAGTPYAASSASDSSIPSASNSLLSGAAFAPPSASATPAPLLAHPAFAPTPVNSVVFHGDPLVEGSRLLDEALTNLRTSNTPDQLKPACTALELYIQNLLNNMSKPQYRRILLSNASYESRVRKTKAAESYLLAAGFEINRPYIEWVLPDASADTPSIPSGSAAEGTGTGLTMDEKQKKQHLEEALRKLREFQTKLQSCDFDGVATAAPPAATTTVTSASSSQASSVSITPAPQVNAPVQPPPPVAAGAAAAPVPYGQPAQQLAPQTSYSAYAQPATSTGQSQLPAPSQQQLVPHPTSAPSSSVYDPSQQPQLPLQPMPQYDPAAQRTLTHSPTPEHQMPAPTEAQQPNGQHSAQQQLSPQLPPQQAPPAQWSAGQTSFNPSQAFSYPNTPFHPTPTMNGADAHYQQQLYSVPNTPLPPPQFQGQYAPHQPQHQSHPTQQLDGYGRPLTQDAYGPGNGQHPLHQSQQIMPTTTVPSMHQPQQAPFPPALEQPQPMYPHAAPPNYNGADTRFGYATGATSSGMEHILAAAGKVNAIEDPNAPPQPPHQQQAAAF